MSGLRTPAFLLIALLAVGCSKSDNANGTDDATDDGDTGGKKDGGKADAGKGDGGKLSQPPDGGKTDGGGVLPRDPTTPWERDDTGNSGLAGGDIDKLKGGGADCAEGSILYPYDGVVFPVGLAPPAIMFKERNDGSYLKLSYEGNDKIKYETAAKATDPGELDIPADAWGEVLGRTNGAPLKAEISIKKGSAVTTCHYTWKVAEGALTGSVFFNTYNHPDLGGQGAVLRLPLGSTESEVYLRYTGVPSIAGPCISCHSVSFNGEKLAASLHNYSPFMLSFEADSYQIGADPQPPVKAKLPESTFGAFTPDGTKMLSMGNPQCTKGADAFPRAPNNFMLIPGPADVQLHDADTGAEIPVKGVDKNWYMWMPQFSPDGTKVVFNHAKPDGNGGTDRRELAIMDFDSATNTFSNLQVIVSKQGPEPSIDYAPLPTANALIPGNTVGGDCDPGTPSNVAAIPGGTCSGPCYPGWPFFTPDGSAVIYVLGSEPDFAAAFPGRDNAAKSELWYVDIESGKQVKLSNAGDGPRPEDGQLNYYPTILPVSIGGYYWLFWTSMRDWGHRDLSTSLAQAGSNWFGGAAVLSAARKRIWVSAIRKPRSTEGFTEDVVDFSSKPFYLEGQSNAGNIRAFATLNPCRQEGDECVSGIDCCQGLCDIKDGDAVGKCVPEKTCSNKQEKCKTEADCCPRETGTPLICNESGFCDVVVQ